MKATLLMAALVLPMSASADIVDIKWDAGAFSHKASIAPKKFLELCGKQKVGEVVTWKFLATGPTDFNIHYHVGKDVSYPENRKGIASAEGSLSAALDQDYCWMWSNKSPQAVDIDVQLRRADTPIK